MEKKRSYDRSFKERAVKLSYERENIKELASELGISSERIYKWRSEYRVHGESSFQGQGIERLSEEGKRVKEKVSDGLIFHSDRGVQYASEEFRNEIKGKIVQSMSRKGDCWDNAVAESFFRSLKCEMIYGSKTLTAEQMELKIFEYIEIWYNKDRRHSALENLTIDEFWNINKQTA